jgi:hypothetical protein
MRATMTTYVKATRAATPYHMALPTAPSQKCVLKPRASDTYPSVKVVAPLLSQGDTIHKSARSC